MGSVIGFRYQNPSVNSKITYLNVFINYRIFFKLWCHNYIRLNIKAPRMASLSLWYSLFIVSAVLSVPLKSVFRRQKIIISCWVLERVWSKVTLLINAMKSLAGSYHLNTELHYYFAMCTKGVPLHHHLRGKNEQPFYWHLGCSATDSLEKLSHFDRPSISALRRLAPTYTDEENQSWFPESRATVTKGHKTIAVAFLQQCV